MFDHRSVNDTMRILSVNDTIRILSVNDTIRIYLCNSNKSDFSNYSYSATRSYPDTNQDPNEDPTQSSFGVKDDHIGVQRISRHDVELHRL